MLDTIILMAGTQAAQCTAQFTEETLIEHAGLAGRAVPRAQGQVG